MKRLVNWKSPALLLVLMSIAGFCLASGQGPLLIAAGAVVCAGWWHTERLGGKSLPRWAVLMLLLGAVVWATYKTTSPRQLDVTLFCEFLTLVLVAKTWDRKRARDIAQLIAMSVFLIIGTILDSNVLSVGLVVLVAMPVTAWAVMTLQIGAGHERAADAREHAEKLAAAARGLELNPVPGRGQRLTERTARRLVPVAVATTGFGFIVAAVVFIIVPRGVAARHWGTWGAPSAILRTGFTEDIELGRAGLLSESQRTVLHAKFSDGNNQSLGGYDQVFYLRGAVLDRYSLDQFGRGRWVSSGIDEPREIALVEPTRDKMIIQEIDLRESTPSNQGAPLFAVWRPGTIHSDTEPVTRRGAGLVWYRDPNKAGPIKYRVISTQHAPPREVAFRFEDVSFPSQVIREYASNVLRNAGVDPDPATRPPVDDASVARILTGHLHGHFQYTTTIGSPPDRQDPIEWFLNTEKKGHCEYFASALAAMCRSVGVNARVIAGYVAMEYDQQADQYTVRESNAHAWTEVEAGPGIWLTFDPTPPIALVNVHEANPTLSTRLARLIDSLNDVWTNSIVMFDNRQQTQVFDFSRVRLPWLEQLTRKAGEEFRASRGRSMIKYSIATAALLVFAVGLSVIAFRAASDIGRIVRRWTGVQTVADSRLMRIQAATGFYGECLQALAQSGRTKPPSATPLAYARSLRTRDEDVGKAFEEIVGLYYRVRFADETLDATQTARAAELTARLKALITTPPKA